MNSSPIKQALEIWKKSDFPCTNKKLQNLNSVEKYQVYSSTKLASPPLAT